MVCLKNVAASGALTFPFASLYYSSLSESRSPLDAKALLALGRTNAEHLFTSLNLAVILGIKLE